MQDCPVCRNSQPVCSHRTGTHIQCLLASLSLTVYNVHKTVNMSLPYIEGSDPNLNLEIWLRISSALTTQWNSNRATSTTFPIMKSHISGVTCKSQLPAIDACELTHIIRKGESAITVLKIRGLVGYVTGHQDLCTSANLIRSLEHTAYRSIYE
jgi:hypothetical protein